MEEYPMEKPESIWQWCGARKTLFTMSQILSMADRLSANSNCKEKQCISDSPLHRSSPSFEGNISKSRTYCRDMCFPVHNSIAEVCPSENGNSTKFPLSVIRHHASSSGTGSDAMSDHQHSDSGLDGQFLRRHLVIGYENPVRVSSFCGRKQPSKGQKAVFKQNRSFSDEQGISGQYATSDSKPSLEASSSCTMSMAIAEDMDLQAGDLNVEMRVLGLIGSRETRSNYINSSSHPPASKKPKRNQSLVFEASKSPLEIEKQRAKSEIRFSALYLLADVAEWSQENDVAGFDDNSVPEEKGIR